MGSAADFQLDSFAKEHKLQGLTTPSLIALIEARKGYSVGKARRFLSFQQRINDELLRHPAITNNQYTAWFEKGQQSAQQIRDFVIQFSVFSNQFLVAQLQKTISADSLEGMRASKEILANEIGVVFNKASAEDRQTHGRSDSETDPELVSTEGTVDGGTFRFRAAHFEWLLRIANDLGLGFADVGRRCCGTGPTLHFCDELIRLYGNADYTIAQAASYAVENWAAAGFWDQLVEGFSRFNERNGHDLPLSFFTWHSKIEAQHAQHTQEELEELYFTRELNEDAFITYGNEMLEGVAVFWDGLEEQRRQTDPRV